MNDLIPLIISGAPRSGTSLIYNLFDGHSSVNWLVDEGFLFEYLYDLGPHHSRALLDALPLDIEAMIGGIRNKRVMPPMHEDYRQSVDQGSVSETHIKSPWCEMRFRQALSTTSRPENIAELWRYLANACLAGEGVPPRRYACMKAPDFGKSVGAALSLIGEARGIVILRNPLRALDSLKRSRELRGQKLLTWPQLAITVGSFFAMSERIDAVDPARLYVLRYEDLIRNPESVMQGLAEWLGIEFEPCLLEPTMRGQQWPGISSFEPTDRIDAGPSRRPLEALSCEEADYIRHTLTDFMFQNGYMEGSADHVFHPGTGATEGC